MVVAGAIPLVLCAAAVLAIGDEFGSAISYHTDRALQVEALGASPFEIAHLLGVGVQPRSRDMVASRSRLPAPGLPAGSRWCSAPPATC